MPAEFEGTASPQTLGRQPAMEKQATFIADVKRRSGQALTKGAGYAGFFIDLGELGSPAPFWRQGFEFSFPR